MIRAAVRPELPTGTVTFLFTDVEGSTRLLHELGAESYAAALAEHRRVVREACTREGGVEVDTQGDAFFFAFSTAPGAAAAASALRDALASGHVQVRVGLHTGTPLLTQEGYVGHDVHRAARIAAAAHGGQIVLSSASHALLDDGFTVVDLGEHRFKDLVSPERVFQLGGGLFPPLRTISNTNLPRPASTFVGRETEIAAVVSCIERGARVLTLTGPAGSGKTRLAIEAAAGLVPEYAAGVHWVGLSALRDPALVLDHIGRTLGAKNGVSGHIGQRNMLILLDNLEQVIDAAPELAELIAECPNLTLLVTSRELLRVRGEVEYAVPPLAEPEAVALFCARSGLSPSDDIAELCARLDSMPLAVELAAGRTKALSPAQILGRLSSWLDLLQGGRDADARQQTLRATIEWSYDLLSDREQSLFAQLAVFAGGWTLEAAEDVCAADVDTLQSLVEKSLVRFAVERYFMFATIRDFAEERLAESGGVERLRRSHAEHFVEAAEAHHRESMYGTDLRAAIAWFRAEQANLRAAVEWTATRTDLHLRLLHSIRSHWILGAKELRALLERALPRISDQPPIVQARAIAGLADALNLTEDFGGALAYRERALGLYLSLDDDEGVGRCFVGLGRDLQGLGRLREARAKYEEGLRMARRALSHPVIAGASMALAFLALEEGDLERALELAGDLEEFEPNDWRVSSAIVGLVALERGEVDKAAQLLAGCVAETYDIGALRSLAFDLDSLAASLAAKGDTERAVVLCGFSESFRDSIGTAPEPYARRLRTSVADAGRLELGEDGYFAATTHGARMSVDEAVELALQDA